MDVILTLDLVKNAGLKMPHFTTPGPVTRHLDAKGYEVTTGIGPDLMQAARMAVAEMVEHLTATRGMAAVALNPGIIDTARSVDGIGDRNRMEDFALRALGLTPRLLQRASNVVITDLVPCDFDFDMDSL